MCRLAFWSRMQWARSRKLLPSQDCKSLFSKAFFSKMDLRSYHSSLSIVIASQGCLISVIDIEHREFLCD